MARGADGAKYTNGEEGNVKVGWRGGESARANERGGTREAADTRHFLQNQSGEQQVCTLAGELLPSAFRDAMVRA